MIFQRMVRDTSGATAAEFSLVLPILLLFLLGMIDVGRLLFAWNMTEKATQVGVRHAVVTDLVAHDLSTYSYISPTLSPGTALGEGKFGTVACETSSSASSAQCSCKQAPCPPLTSHSNIGVRFNAIFERMQKVYPQLDPKNIVISYSDSGLGFAGNPHGPDVSPLVTVTIRDAKFQPMIMTPFGGAFKMPDFRSSMMLEDGAGDKAN